MNEERKLLKGINQAAIDLISIHDSGLSDNAIKCRVKRIANDLEILVKGKETKEW